MKQAVGKRPNNQAEGTRRSRSTKKSIIGPLLTVEEAATYMRVSRQTAYDEVAEAKWPIVRVRSRIFVVKALLDEMIEEQARSAWKRST